MVFDSDLSHLYLDSCVTGGLTGFKSDFITGTYGGVQERPTDTTTGKAIITGEGIAAYTFKDDTGKLCTLKTQMSYSPSSKYRLMSPQWLGIQEREKGTSKDKRSRCTIEDEEAVLLFDNRIRRVTIKHDPKMLVPVLTVNPGIKNYQSFVTAFCSVIQKETDFQCMPKDYVENSAYEEKYEGVCLQSIDTKRHLSTYQDEAELIKQNEDLEDKLLKVQEEAHRIGTASTLDKDQQQLLRIHERYNHVISVPDIQLLAATGVFPKRLSKCTRPACAACCYGAAQRKPWQTKVKYNEHIFQKMKHLPGEIDHMDLMTSSVPGLITQMVSFLTSKKFYYTSFFIDDRSDYTFAHHQETTCAEEKITSKQVYESDLRKFGKEVRHYHAENCTYAVTRYKEEIEEKKQTLTFCGVGSHHQNGKAENRIKIICNPARTMLIHAIHRWPEVITQSAWPYAISLAVDVRNRCKLDKNGLSPLYKLSTIKHSIDLCNNHTFGCPCYVITAKLQDHNSIPRWDERIRVGAYLGRYKNHTSNVALVLNLQTGHISPQFHVVFDDNFETVDSLRKGTEPARWKWLASHKREYHLNNNKEIIDGTKIWTDSELESSTLFEVPKNNNINTTNNSSLTENIPSIPLERLVINNNNEEANTSISQNNDADTNRSHDLLQSNETISPVSPPLDESK